MNNAENLLSKRLNANPQHDIVFFQKVAPIVQSMMDDLIEQMDARFNEFGSSYGELYINLFAINKILIDKKIVTTQEMQASIDTCSKEFMKMMHDEDKEERAGRATTIKV